MAAIIFWLLCIHNLNIRTPEATQAVAILERSVKTKQDP